MVVLGGRRTDPSCKIPDIRSAAPYLVSIAGSAGAFDPLAELLEGLPSVCAPAIAVALHTGPRSLLVDALTARSQLPVAWAQSGVAIESGRVYVAPVGAHLVVNPDARLTVSYAPRIRWYRPSADWLFESAAASFADRHVAIVLSGMLSDGKLGLGSVKRRGGCVLVQAPWTCRHRDMPEAAIATGHVDAVLPMEEIVRRVLQIFAERRRQHDLALWDDPFGCRSAAS